MDIFLLLLLMISGAVLIIPGIIKERALDSPLDTVTDFRRGMAALAVSTHDYKKSMADQQYYKSREQYDPEPYVRRSSYSDYDNLEERDFIPYPTNKARMEMETRRQQIMVALWIVALGTGIITLIPKLKWMIQLHIAVLVLLAGYSLVVMLLPHYDRYR